MRSKRRFLSMLVAVAMLCTMLPLQVLAAAPTNPEAVVSGDNKVVTLTFGAAITNEKGDLDTLKGEITLSTDDGSQYNPLAAEDSIKIDGSALVITFNAALSGTTNKIKINQDAISDGSGNKNAEIVTAALVLQPAAPSNLEIDYEQETLTNYINSTMEVSEDNGTSYSAKDLADADVFSALIPAAEGSAKTVLVRLKKDGGTPAGIAATVEIPARPAADLTTAIFDYKAETFTITSAYNYEIGTSSQSAYGTVGSGSAVDMKSDIAAGSKSIFYIKNAAADAFKSAEGSLALPTRPAADLTDAVIDFTAETITIPDDYHYEIGATSVAAYGTQGSGSAVDVSGSIAAYGNTPNHIFYVKDAVDNTSLQSVEGDITIPARPAAPTDLNDMTVDQGTAEGKVGISVAADFEYKITSSTGNADSTDAAMKQDWTKGKGEAADSTATVVAGDKIWLRVAPTATAFASEPAAASHDVIAGEIGEAGAPQDQSDATVTIAEGNTVTAGAAVTINITDAKGANGTALSGALNVKVVSNKTADGTNGTLFDNDVTFTTGSGDVTILADQLKTAADDTTLTVTIQNVTEAKKITPVTVNAATAAQLSVKTEPTAPAANGGALATQPIVEIQDQYGNVVTDSADQVTASATQNTWTLGGTKEVNAVSGVATFSGLTATSDAAVNNATITFTATLGGKKTATSASFNIPAPAAPTTFTATVTTKIDDAATDVTKVELQEQGTTTKKEITSPASGVYTASNLEIGKIYEVYVNEAKTDKTVSNESKTVTVDLYTVNAPTVNGDSDAAKTVTATANGGTVTIGNPVLKGTKVTFSVVANPTDTIAWSDGTTSGNTKDFDVTYDKASISITCVVTKASLAAFDAAVNVKVDGTKANVDSVALKPVSGQNITMTSSVDGEYTVAGVAPGIYTVVVNGMETAQQVNSATPVEVNLFTVTFNAKATGSGEGAITAQVDGEAIDSGDLVLSGKVVTFTVETSIGDTIAWGGGATGNTATTTVTYNQKITGPISCTLTPSVYKITAIGNETTGTGAGYSRVITTTGTDGSQYLVVQITEGAGTNAKVSVVMVKADASVTVSYKTANAKVTAWLADQLPNLTGTGATGATIYDMAESN